MFCVSVTFQVAPGHHDRFVDRIRTFAEASRTEPGCQAFEAWSEQGQPGAVYLYEKYEDRAAFDAHLAAPHFHAFDGEVTPYVLTRTVVTWDTQI